jgi:hypothetical protein
MQLLLGMRIGRDMLESTRTWEIESGINGGSAEL